MKTKLIILFSVIIVLLAIIYTVLLINVVSKGSHSDNTSPKDAIIVLGYSLDNGDTPSDYLIKRMETALSLYTEGYAKNIIVTGGRGPTDNIPVAIAMKKWFIDNGVPVDFIYTDTISNNTYENFVFAKEICKENDFNSVMVVTNDFHMYRSMTICKEFFYDYTGYSASLPLSFKKVGLYLKEPLSFIKYEVFTKNTSEKVLEKKKDLLLLSQKPYDTKEKYTEFINRPETTKYDISASFDENTNILSGTSTITYKNSSSVPINNIVLNLYHNRLSSDKYSDKGYITISSVKEGNKALSFTDSKSYIDISINTLNPGKSITFSTDFSAYIPAIKGSTGGNENGVWAKDIFPVVAKFYDKSFLPSDYYDYTDYAYNDMSIYSVSIETDIAYKVVLPDVTTDTKADTKISKMNDTLLRNLSFAILKNNKSTSLASNSNTELTVYHLDESANVYDILYKIESAISYMNKTVGTYPYSSLKVVLVDLDVPMVTYSSGIIFIDETYLTNPNVQLSVCKAVVNQWFGSIILSDPKTSSYLTNGLSSFLASNIYNPSLSLNDYFESEYDLLEASYDSLNVKKLNTDIDEFYSYNNYYYIDDLKAELMIYSLYNTIFDTWNDFLRNFYKTYSFSVIDYEDFTSYSNDYSTDSLDDFFESWLNLEDLQRLEN